MKTVEEEAQEIIRNIERTLIKAKMADEALAKAKALEAEAIAKASMYAEKAEASLKDFEELAYAMFKRESMKVYKQKRRDEKPKPVIPRPEAFGSWS